jgi:hypothetical protein
MSDVARSQEVILTNGRFCHKSLITLILSLDSLVHGMSAGLGVLRVE